MALYWLNDMRRGSRFTRTRSYGRTRSVSTYKPRTVLAYLYRAWTGLGPVLAYLAYRSPCSVYVYISGVKI